MTTKRIDQFVHTLNYGDAISSEVLALQRVFKKAGIVSDIYAINIHPAYRGQSGYYYYQNYKAEKNSAVILHYSLGSPLNQLYLSLNSVTRYLIYHNLTPSYWFEGVNPRIVEDIKVGLEQLPQLCRCTDHLIADSSFNAEELKKLGFEATVLNLPVDAKRWEIEADGQVVSTIKSQEGIHLLHVGRMAPNKCLEDILKVFYFLNKFSEKKSYLWLVGTDTDTEIYAFSLKLLAQELQISSSVNFISSFNDAKVKALYQNCTAYLCMSEHEGFCLPVVESMYFGLPVIAYDSSALPDTLSNAGVLVKEKRPAHIAELIKLIDQDATIRSQLITAGKQRVDRLSLEVFENNVRQIFLTNLGENLAKCV